MFDKFKNYGNEMHYLATLGDITMSCSPVVLTVGWYRVDRQ